MSTLDQCPSTGKAGTLATAKRDAAEAQPATARDVSSATGKAYWRSLDDLAGTREFRDFVEREFPAQASELLSGSRRHFLRIMGASLALAGAAAIPGCRRPDHKILAYHAKPEDVIPGKPLYYATAMQVAGRVEGLLATTYEGRPTKLDGNPMHPVNRGKTGAQAQAAILSLYDPDRSPEVAASRTGGELMAMEWGAFAKEARTEFGAFDSNGGKGLAFLVGKKPSPTRDRMKAEAMRRWPQATWHVYEPADNAGEIAGTAAAFGQAMHVERKLENVRTLVSLDHDLLGSGTLPELRGYGKARIVPGAADGREAADTEMMRVYAVETTTTLTGGQADHRMPLKPSQVGAFAVALADRLAALLGDAASPIAAALAGVRVDASVMPTDWADALADDLVGAGRNNLGTSLITCGPSQPAAVHALVAAMNQALGNVGKTVGYYPLPGDMGVDSVASIGSLANAIENGLVDTLVMMGVNPVYDAPADLDFAGKLGAVRKSYCLGDPSETALASSVWLHEANPLETWGDLTAPDGTHTVTQPMIAPLYGGKSDIELMAIIMGMPDDGFDHVRDTLALAGGLSRSVPGSNIVNPAFDTLWRRTVHDGMAPNTQSQWVAPRVLPRGLATAMATADFSQADGEIEVLFAACPRIHDGRYANNGWLQETPGGIDKVTWDNPILMSLKTANRLGLNPDRHLGQRQYNSVQVVDVTVGGKTVRGPLWVTPGMADDAVQLTLGYGRAAVAGRVAEETGYNAYPARTSGAMSIARGAEVARARGQAAYLIATTQDHWTLHTEERGVEIFREVDLYWWKKDGDRLFQKKDAYGNKKTHNAAGMMGIESHAPANEDAYKAGPNRRGGSIYYHKVDEKGKPILDDKGNKQRPENQYGKGIQQWGMSIDLSTCTGCNACVTACQSENNIPIVGKKEVAKGREMSWIRVDRYFASSVNMEEEAFANPDISIQPVTCMHCESAPCEVVCPVNATVHSDRGTNDMAYNRCIGTRYCSNNCPYKVRRFNYFDYGTKQFKGEVYGKPDGAPVPENLNLIPPRLREKNAAVTDMQKNPNVTVRSRGVMEKCTYCIQRINAASVETKLEDLDFIPDGFFEVACQQACPTGAIQFGDIYDNDAHGGKGSLVKQAKDSGRTYAMLSYLNIAPRTTYQMRIRNPHPSIREHAAHSPFEHHGHDDHKHDDHKHGHSGDDAHAMSLPVLNNLGAMA